MKTTLQILTEGLEVIRDPKHWCQGVLAYDAEGAYERDPTNPACTCWCSVGVIMKVANNPDYPDESAYQALKSAAGDDPARFNDNHTHEQVVQLWEKAIEHARN